MGGQWGMSDTTYMDICVVVYILLELIGVARDGAIVENSFDGCSGRVGRCG